MTRSRGSKTARTTILQNPSNFPNSWPGWRPCFAAGAPTPPVTEPVTFGAVVLDRERRQVFVDGREVELSVKEFGVLDLLAEAPGRPRTREEILDRVWGWDFEGSARTVDNFIVSLRQKLEQDPGHPRHIVTVRGLGYKLVAAGSG